MPTVINNPPANNPPVQQSTDDSRGLGFFIGLVVLIILAILLFAYVIPGLRRGSTSSTNNTPGVSGSVTTPNGSTYNGTLQTR